MYDFSTLSPLDFERLSRDLLSRSLGIEFESFKPGRDRGIDIRGSSVAGEIVIGQCKHYLRTGYAGLLAACKKEILKIQAEKPTRYILATSVPLNPDQKDALLNALSPWCLGTDDIYGQDDLNALLRSFPGVEKSHFKLWLTSSAALERIVNASSYTRGDLFVGDLDRRISLFVPIAGIKDAEEALAQHGYCVIAGIPGIGKTTLAEILCIHHMYNGYEVVVIGSDAVEAFNRYSESSKQIFYYDDFLGQTSIDDKLNPKEDVELIRLLNAVRHNNNKRLIMTTREYILNQARFKYERLDRAGLHNSQCVVTLESYTRVNRAEILVNHLYFNNIDRDKIGYLVASGLHKEVIDHPNYNPRIIETMCDLTNTLALSPEEWTDQFMKSMSNPDKIWSHAFWNQISSQERDLIVAASSLPNTVRTEILEHAWLSLLDSGGLARPSHFDYRKSLNKLDGTFLNIFSINTNHLAELCNPSVRDYVKTVLNEDNHYLGRLIDSAICFEQVDRIIAWFGTACSGSQFLLEKLTNAGLRAWNEPPIGVSVFRGVLIEQRGTVCPALRLSRIASAVVDSGRYQELEREVLGIFTQSIPAISIEGATKLFQAIRDHCNQSNLDQWINLLLEKHLEYWCSEDEYASFLDLTLFVSPCQKDRLESKIRADFIESMRHTDWDHIHDCDSASDSAQTIKELSDHFRVDPAPWLLALDERVKVLESERDNSPEEEYEEWSSEPTAETTNDQQIDAMFAGLLNQ